MDPFSLKSALTDPETALAHVTMMSVENVTVSQTIVSGDNRFIGYEENITLTASALLDGVHRNSELDEDVPPDKFIEDVVEELKRQNEGAVMKTEDR